MKRILILAGLAAVLAGALWGCGGGGDTVLAQVGPRKITEQDFTDALAGMKPEDRPALTDMESKEKFLNDLVNRDLMELAAFKAYPELTEQQGWRLKRFRDSQLTNLARRRLVRDQIQVTEAMKDTLYQDLKTERHLLGMLLIDADQADYVRKKLDEGGDWATLTRDNSAHWSANEPPGDLGWMKAGQFLPSIETKVWEAPIGATIGPDRAAMGWYIFRVLDERPSDPGGTREELDSFLANKLLEPLYMYRQRVVLDSLRDAAGPSYPSEGVALMMSKYYWEPPEDQKDNPYARMDSPRESPELTPEEQQVTVIDFANIPDWNAKEFIERLEWYPLGIWPTGASETELTDLYDIMVRDYLWIKAAEDLGITSDPKFQKTMDRREREMKVTYFYYNDVMAKLDVTQDQIQNWFEENRERYKAPPSVKLAYFVSKDKDLIENLAADWNNGMSFMALREKYEPRDPDLQSNGESPWAYSGQDPLFDEKIASLDEGQISEPITRADVTSVYRVVAKRDSMYVGYEEIKEQVDKDAKTALGDEYFKDFLAQQKENFPVTIHEKALEKFEVPAIPASEDDGGDDAAQQVLGG